MKLVRLNFIDSIAYYFGIVKNFWSIRILNIWTDQFHNYSIRQLHQQLLKVNYSKRMHLHLLDELFQDEGSYGCTDGTHKWDMK